MKYAGMPFGMWVLFAGSFQKQLTAVLGYDADTAKAITKKAKPQYRQIIRSLPEFEKTDRFKINLVNLCAAVYPCLRWTLLRLRVQKEKCYLRTHICDMITMQTAERTPASGRAEMVMNNIIR